MKSTVGFCEFCDRFRDMNRNENFSYEGKRALFDWLEEYENETGEEIELDVIALCCEYSEYANIEEFRKDYGEEYENIQDIEDKTIVIPVGNEGFIIQQF
jgi:hypothetical protein